jgi:hypothetical protein
MNRSSLPAASRSIALIFILLIANLISCTDTNGGAVAWDTSELDGAYPDFADQDFYDTQEPPGDGRSNDDMEFDKDSGLDASTDMFETTDICQPNCHERECGPDGCGGTCGKGCGDPCDQICDELLGLCMYSHCYFPNGREGKGPLWAITSIRIAGLDGDRCQDFDGDGKVDNSIRSLVEDPGDLVADWYSPLDLRYLLHWTGFLSDICLPWSAEILQGTLANPDMNSEEFLVSRDSWGDSAFRPNAYSCNGVLEDGELVAHLSPATWFVPLWAGLDLMLSLNRMRIDADATEGALAGTILLSSGTASGILERSEIEGILEALHCDCDSAPTDNLPDFCAQIPDWLLDVIQWDLHLADDSTITASSPGNPGNAASFCLEFDSIPAHIVGTMD